MKEMTRGRRRGGGAKVYPRREGKREGEGWGKSKIC